MYRDAITKNREGESKRALNKRDVLRISKVTREGLLLLIKSYQLLISPVLGQHCRFYPSCSKYAQIAISQYGIARGLGLFVKRILKCHPWHPGGYDPVPKNN